MLTTSRTRRVVIDADATNEPSTLGSRVSNARLLQLPKVTTSGALTLLLVLTVVVLLWSWCVPRPLSAGRDIPDVRREALAGRGGLSRESVVLQAAVKTNISRRRGHTEQGVEPAGGERLGEDGEEHRRAEDKHDSKTGWNYAEEASAGNGGGRTGEASVPEEGATKGAWRWTGSIWRKVYLDADGNEERRNITWFERQTVQDRLDFNQYINCKDSPPDEAPSVDGLPLAKMLLPVNDFIVHQGNYERLRKGADAGQAEQIQAPNLLPEDGESVLLRRRWGSCAVVGNSGALRLTQMARAIDSHDTVVRLNQAPTDGYMRRVGAKTTFRLLNKLWTRTYRNTAGMKRGSILPVEDGVTFLVSRASSQEFELLSEFMRAYHPDVTTLYLASRAVSMSTPLLQGYRERLCAYGYGPFVGLNVPSSGYVAVYMLRRLCERVTVYGFGVRGMKGSKLDINTQGGFGYHYYRGVGSRAVGDDVHCFDCEEYLLKAMAAANLVDFCTFLPGNDTHNWACGCRHGDAQQCAPPSYPSWLRSTDDCDPTGMYDDCKDLKERRIDAAFQRSRLQLSGSGDALDADSSLSESGKASAVGGRPRPPHRS